MPKPPLKIDGYNTLISQLKSIFIEGMQRIEEEKVRTYWRTGRLISNYILANKERADYGESLYDKLENDLGIERTTLLRSVQFYRVFPIIGALRQLTWMHYCKLVTIDDKAKRELLAARAEKKEWSYRQLGEAIRLEKLKIEEPADKSKSAITKLSVTRSRLFTYQILEPNFIHPIEERLVIDLGFTFIIQAEARGIKLKAGEIIESLKDKEDYTLKYSNAKPKELYAYKALVERVIDADTILLDIDLGFSSWTRQKVRLRGIDAPEVSTTEGKEAKNFVEAKLKETEFVIVKTYKSDKYDRYLADIFYLPAGKAGQAKEKELQLVLEQGIFLNQQLLDLDLAQTWQE